MHDPDATSYDEQSKARWSAAAEAWEQERDRMWDASHAVSEGLVAMAAPKPGETVLDVAAGAGDTGFLAAQAVGRDGHLISTDRSPEMLAAGERRARELGLENVEFRVLDAEAMDLDTDSVDVVVCRWGYMVMSHPAKALAETRRVLRPDGRLALAVWAPREDNPWNTVLTDPFIERGLLPLPDPDEPGPFRLGDRSELEALVSGAGFASVELTDLPVMWRFDSVDEYWAVVTHLSPLISTTLRTLASAEVESLKAAVAERSRPFHKDGRYLLPGAAIGMLAR